MKVYVVFDGQYSDRYVFGIFSTKEKAAEVGSDDIEEHELDTLVGHSVGPVYKTRICLDDGEVMNDEPPSWYKGEGTETSIRHRAKAVVNYSPWLFDGERRDSFVVRSPISYEHAIKVAVESRQKWIREGRKMSSFNVS